MKEKSISETAEKLSLSGYPYADYFLCECQKPVVQEFWNEYEPIVRQLNDDLSEIPKLYGQEDLGMSAIVYAHYFGGATDIFITEFSEDDAFGYAILGGDYENSELGYIPIREVVNIELLNLDFYWERKPLNQALHELDPSYFIG